MNLQLSGSKGAIFSGGFPGGHYNKDGPDNTLYATSQSGFMDSELYQNWFEKIFLKFTPHDYTRLLLQDGHASHINMKLIDMAVANNVILLCLPPHTTHLLQPLDVAVYKSLKSNLSKHLSAARLFHTDLWVSKKNFTAFFKEPYELALSMHNIKQGFRKCGIHPFNPNSIDKSLLSVSQNVPQDVNLATATPVANTNSNATDHTKLADVPGTSGDLPVPATSSTEAPSTPSEYKLASPTNVAVTPRTRARGNHTATDSGQITGAADDIAPEHLPVNSCTPSSANVVDLASPQNNPLVKCGIISESLAQVLLPPKQGEKKPVNRRIITTARVITSEDYSKQLREKERKIEEQEAAKQQRKEQRERKKAEKEQMQAKRKVEAESRGKSIAAKKRKEEEENDDSDDSDSAPIDQNKCSRPGCYKRYHRKTKDLWVGCENCDRWYHVNCTDLEGVKTSKDLEEMGDWFCDHCM